MTYSTNEYVISKCSKVGPTQGKPTPTLQKKKSLGASLNLK